VRKLRQLARRSDGAGVVVTRWHLVVQALMRALVRLELRAPQDGCLARSTRIAFSIGSTVAWEQLCGRRLRSRSPSGPSRYSDDPAVARWA
jgi:hypothetical protein